MSGPIVRSGPSRAYTQNWDRVFSKPKKTRGPKKVASGAKRPPKKK